MPLITSAGIGSGLDLESIIQASVEAENYPKLQLFAEKEKKLQVELSGIGAVKSALSQLQETIKKLADMSTFQKREASITQPASGEAISVTTTSDSTPGNFDIEVNQLAQGSRAVSNSSLFSAGSDVVTASGGTLTFTAGSKTFDVTLDAGATLDDLRAAINDSDSNFGVSANIVNTGSEAKLVLTSSVTGSGNDLVVTNDTAELDNVSTVANAGGAGGMAIATADQATDAMITVDGLTITNDTNTFKDAVQDLTIKALQETETGESARLRVNVDTEAATTLIDKFIADYNNLIGTIGYQTRPTSGLAGDATMRSLESQIFNTLSTTMTGVEPFGTLFDIGLTVDKDGYLEKSSTVRSLSESLSDYFPQVGELFAGVGGIGEKFEETLGNYLDSGGLIKVREQSLNSELDDLDDDVANHTYRMEQLEARLRKKYSGLDVLLAQMQSSQQYLTAQLASLPGFTSNKKS